MDQFELFETFFEQFQDHLSQDHLDFSKFVYIAIGRRG